MLAAIAAVLLAAPLLTRAQGAPDLQTVLSQNANLSTFSELTKTYSSVLAGLPNSNITVLAPSDAAFRKFSSWDSKNATLATELLQYSVLRSVLSMASIAKGQSVFAQTCLNDSTYANVTGGQNIIFTKQPNGDVVLTSGLASRSTVLDADVAFDGGLVQVIDSLTVVPVSLEDTARNAYTDLEAFVGAAFSTQLESAFTDTPNITLFVPRNAAFQAVAGALSGLGSTELSRVLKYHMVTGQVVPSYGLASNLTLTTAAGGELTITRLNNDIFVNSALIIQTDVLVTNGVVQMLDAVLNPDDPALPDTEGGGASQAPVFTGSGSAATATATGSVAPTPYVTDLPCGADCASSTGMGTDGGAVPTSSKNGVAPRCTGLAGAGMAAGMVAGIGMGLFGMA